MPPEPVPLDRKDFVFRERKHDRGPPSDGLGGGDSSGLASPSISTPRWRDQYHSPSPRRALSGHYRQVFPDEPGRYGFTPTRSEGEGFRSRYGGGSGSGRNSSGRENRGYFRRSPWNPGDPPRQHHDFVASTAQRSVADPLIPASSSSSQLPSLKDRRDKYDGGVNDGPHTGLGEDRDPDHSLGPIAWKPLKWSRSGSFSSSTKPIRSESDGGKVETSVPPGKETSSRSLALSPTPSDEGSARKKPRLGWGQGLMKYEKQKEGPEDSSWKNMTVQGSSGAKLTTSEASTRLTGPGGSTSPATPSSTTCSSSHAALDEKLDYNTEINDGTSHLSNSPAHEFQRSPEEFSMNLEHFNAVSLRYVNSLIDDALQPEDVCSGDSSSTRQSASDKLSLLKGDILEALEKTVVDIDSFESEVKNLDFELKKTCVCHASQAKADSVTKNDCNICSRAPSKESDSTSIFPSCEAPHHHDDSLDKIQVEAKEHQLDGTIIINNLEKQDLVNAMPGRLVGYTDNTQTTGSEDLETKTCSLVDPGEAIKSLAVSPVDGDHKDDICASCVKSLNGEVDCSLVAQIIASNRESARKASEVLGKWLPSKMFPFDGESQNMSLKIRNKLGVRKKFLKFKERALTLKFRAFHLLWKEDIRLLSIMKHCPKSQKRCELSCRSSQNGSQKHKMSCRSQLSLPGNLVLMPTKEIVDFTSKLLLDSKIKIHRNYLKMPALILDERERSHSRFITKNGLIEDPLLIEKERALINPWSTEEKRIFLEMLGTFGKDFKKVASFLEHKTTADCVEFYYRNQKSESFEAAKKRLIARKQWQSLPSNSYMVPSGDKWKCEFDSAPLDILGEASVMVAHSNDNRIRQKRSCRSIHGSPHDLKLSRGSYTRASNDEFYDETTAADVLAGIGNSISSEGMGSCITTSVDFGEKLEFVQVDRPFFPEVTQTIDEEDTCSDEGFGVLESVDWTDEEKSVFIRALGLYGRDFTRISHYLGTRSKEQCKIFFSKARKCLALDVICQGVSGNDEEIPSCNEGRSDTDDACVAEMDSAICSNQSCSKVDDFTQSVMSTSRQEFLKAVNFHPQTDTQQYESKGPSPEGVHTMTVKLTSVFFDNDRRPLTIRETNRLGRTPEEMPSAALRKDNSEKSYGAVDNGIKKHINALISPVPSATKQEFVKLEPNSWEDLPPVAVNCHADNGSKCKIEPCFPDTGAKCKVELPQFAEPVIGCDSSQKSKICKEPTPEPTFDMKGNTCPQENMACFPSIVFTPNHQNQVQLSLLSHSHKNQVFSWRQKENCASISAKPTPDASYTQFNDHLDAAKQYTHGLEDLNNKKHLYSYDRDTYQHCLLGNEYSARASEPLHILRGYPLRMLNGNEMAGDNVDFDQKMFSLNLSKKSGNLDHVLQLVPSLHSEKCSSHRHGVVDLSVPFVHKNNDSSDTQLRPCSQGPGSEAEEQSLCTRDFKLFGKILSHPSPIQKSQEMDKSSSPKPSSSSLKPPIGMTDKAFVALQTETMSSTGFEELPLRTYGFWDGRRIQTGFSSLPEPANVLSKYPGGLPGVAYYTSKENAGGNGLPIQQRSFSIDGNRKDVFSELQKRNGLETLSDFQQQGRVGTGSSLVGISCTGGVSDPVAAIRMCYASQTGLLSQEDESWRGDRGGR